MPARRLRKAASQETPIPRAFSPLRKHQICVARQITTDVLFREGRRLPALAFQPRPDENP